MSFSDDILRLRYSWDGKETWEDIARRVTRNVLSVLPVPQDTIDEAEEYISTKKFIPGGRFLAQAGRDYHQTSNCFLFRADDTREGWGDLLSKATLALMSGGGIGVDYSALRASGAPLRSSGGTSSGPLPLMKVVNEVGRGVMAGGKRRSAIWGGLNWSHPDVISFIRVKNWPEVVRAEKARDMDFPAAMDMTNVSVILDADFFTAYSDPAHLLHSHAHEVYDLVIKKMVTTGEPGFSVDYANKNESLRNAPVTKETKVLLDTGYTRVADIIGTPVTIWTGVQWAPNVVFSKTYDSAPIVRVSMSNGRTIRCEENHEFFVLRNSYFFLGGEVVAVRVPEKIKACNLRAGDDLLVVMPDNSTEDVSILIGAEYDGFEDVYCADVRVSEHSFMAEGVIISNCTEIVSEDDSDVCTLGSINFGRISNLDELAAVSQIGTLFLLAGTVYSDVPFEKIRTVREKNRRLGLGAMGLAEFMAHRGIPYGPNDELATWLGVWKDTSDYAANKYADMYSLNRPVAKRAIAPNGTISIIAGTTSGIEPIFSKAFLRRYLSPDGWQEQVVIDPVALDLYTQGVDPDTIEDAYTLSHSVERRIAFQAFVQGYVDNAISSTINLPAYGQPGNDNPEAFGATLMKYLPQLRGVTAFPDGSRGMQVLTQMDFKDALRHHGYIVEGSEDTCVGGVCGI